jgi:hypothetical protein
MEVLGAAFALIVVAYRMEGLVFARLVKTKMGFSTHWDTG